MRLKGSGNLEAIHIIKKLGGSLTDSYLDEGERPEVTAGSLASDWLLGGSRVLLPAGFLLDKKIGVNQPKRLENVKILIANTGMDTDKIKVCTQRRAHTHTHS